MWVSVRGCHQNASRKLRWAAAVGSFQWLGGVIRGICVGQKHGTGISLQCDTPLCPWWLLWHFHFWFFAWGICIYSLITEKTSSILRYWTGSKLGARASCLMCISIWLFYLLVNTHNPCYLLLQRDSVFRTGLICVCLSGLLLSVRGYGQLLTSQTHQLADLWSCSGRLITFENHLNCPVGLLSKCGLPCMSHFSHRDWVCTAVLALTMKVGPPDSFWRLQFPPELCVSVIRVYKLRNTPFQGNYQHKNIFFKVLRLVSTIIKTVTWEN